MACLNFFTKRDGVVESHGVLIQLDALPERGDHDRPSSWEGGRVANPKMRSTQAVKNLWTGDPWQYTEITVRVLGEVENIRAWNENADT
jgi:hypothetical protein